jgi:hypothetical protein
MTVTRVGEVRYIEVLNPPEALSKDDLSGIEKALRRTPFRPSLKEGKAVTTEGFIFQHVVAPEAEEPASSEEHTS